MSSSKLLCPLCGTEAEHLDDDACHWAAELERLRAENINYKLSATARTRIGFSYAKGLGGFLSRIIMAVTGAPCSHIWLLYWDNDFDCDMVMEAHTEWRLIPFQDFKKKNHIVKVFTPASDIDIGLKAGGRLLGTRYDVEGLLGNLWVILGEWLKRKWHNPFRSRRVVFCSEGVARVLIAAKYPGIKDRDVSDIRPEHILRLLSLDGSRVWNASMEVRK